MQEIKRGAKANSSEVAALYLETWQAANGQKLLAGDQEGKRRFMGTSAT